MYINRVTGSSIYMKSYINPQNVRAAVSSNFHNFNRTKAHTKH